MYTYDDYLKINSNDPKAVMDFVFSAIQEHKATDIYNTAVIAEEYNKHRNVTISQYQKLLYTITGKAIPDNYSANFKLASRFFHRFVTQENQYLLGNGITWQDDGIESKLGDDFDVRMQNAGKFALIGGVSFVFYNMDHVEVFKVTEYAPLLGEENGAMMAGIRFWQVDPSKPLRATFYELDGYTEFIWDNGDTGISDKWDLVFDGMGMIPKRPYKLKIRTSEADGVEIYDGENYPTFPIVPLWGNPEHQSEIVGLREQIDCYDLIKSGYANTVDEGSIIYWLVQNAGGMDDTDLVKFVERIKTMHAASVGEDTGDAKAEAHTIEPPYQSRESLLTTLRDGMYEDAMALDTKSIADGAVTATQIEAAYEPLNSKTDEFEGCVWECLQGILNIAGLPGEKPTFTRSLIVNRSEEIDNVIKSAEWLDDEYMTEKLLTILGDGDLVEEILERIKEQEMDRMGYDDEEDMDEEALEDDDFDIDSDIDALLAELEG